MTVLLVVSVLALAVVVVWGFMALRRLRPPAGPASVVPAAAMVERRVVVVLDVDGADPATPAVQRLVHETAARLFAAMPDADEVEVRARDGSVLGHVARFTPEPHLISMPQFLYEPRAPRRHGPDLSEHLNEDEPFPAPVRDGPIEVPAPAPGLTAPRERRRPVAERFDLVPGVRARVLNAYDLVDVVRAILEAVNLSVHVDDDLVRVDDLAIAVVRHIDGGAHDALNHAYRRVAASGAARGLVVALDYIDPQEVRRRELLAPEVLHVGFAGVQRMADAVALGADPIRFAVGPSLAPASAAVA